MGIKFMFSKVDFGSDFWLAIGGIMILTGTLIIHFSNRTRARTNNQKLKNELFETRSSLEKSNREIINTQEHLKTANSIIIEKQAEISSLQVQLNQNTTYLKKDVQSKNLELNLKEYSLELIINFKDLKMMKPAYSNPDVEFKIFFFQKMDADVTGSVIGSVKGQWVELNPGSDYPSGSNNFVIAPTNNEIIINQATIYLSKQMGEKFTKDRLLHFEIMDFPIDLTDASLGLYSNKDGGITWSKSQLGEYDKGRFYGTFNLNEK